MTAQEDVTTAKTASFDVLREIRGPSGSLKILSGLDHETTEATYSTGWDFPDKEYDDLALGTKYRKLLVADLEGTRRLKLVAMTAIQVDGVIYKNPSKDPRLHLSGSVPVYEFKVSPTGERV